MASRINVQNQNASYFNKISGGGRIDLTMNSGLPVFSPTGYSVAGWIKPINSTLGATSIYAEANSASNNQLFTVYLFTTGGQEYTVVSVKIRNDANVLQVDTSSNKKIRVDEWSHFAWVDNNGAATIYINGVADTANNSYTPSGSYTFNTACIGAINRSGGILQNFNGSIARLQLFNSVLSASDVKALYAQGTVSVKPVGQYMLGEGAGTVAYDSSGNTNDGTISSGVWSSDTPFKKRKLVNDNMVYNGDFEYAPVVNVPTTTAFRWIDGTAAGAQGPSTGIFGWGTETITGSGGGSFDTTTKHSGNASLKVSTTATASRVQISQKANSRFINSTIPALPNTSYTFSGWIKTLANSGSATSGAELKVGQLTGDNTTTAVTTTLATGIVATQDWTYYTTTFTTGSTTRYMNVRALVTGNDGTATLIMDAWFDDIQLRPTTTPTRRNIRNMTSSLSFSSTNSSKADTASNSTTSLANGFTVAGWVRFTTSDRSITPRIISNPNWGFGIVQASNKIRFTTLSIKDYDGTGQDIPLDQWTHIAAVMDSSNGVSLYMNGQLDTFVSGTTPANTASGVTRIGGGVTGGLAEIKVWNTQLTASQIYSLYSNNIYPQAGLIADYPLDDGSGTVARDISGNGNNGTITSGTWSTDVPFKSRTSSSGRSGA